MNGWQQALTVLLSAGLLTVGWQALERYLNSKSARKARLLKESAAVHQASGSVDTADADLVFAQIGMVVGEWQKIAQRHQEAEQKLEAKVEHLRERSVDQDRIIAQLVERAEACEDRAATLVKRLEDQGIDPGISAPHDH